MRLIAPPGVGLAPLRGRLNFPAHSLTLIAKATLALEPGGNCKLVRDDEKGLPLGDIPYEEDELGTGAPRYESDYAYFKPNADVMVVGHFHAPNGQPVRVGEVAVTVGNRTVRAAVVGRRRWYGSGPLPGGAQAEPFNKLELRWSHAFGGEGNGLNPVGVGYVPAGGLFKARDFQREPLELPRIERFEKQISHVDQANEPICFAPRAKVWPVRRNLIGTCDERWQKTRWPWFPEDCDMRHFQAAIPELQVREYLRGDERLRFKNMHPGVADYETFLPGVRLVAAVQRTVQGDKPAHTDAVALALDTLWVDMDTMRAHLVWRGVCATRDADASDIAFAWIGLSTVHEELTAEQIAARADAEIAADEAQWTVEAEPEPEPPAMPPLVEAPEEDALGPELRALLAGIPAPAPLEAPVLSAEQQAHLDEVASKASAQLEEQLKANQAQQTGSEAEPWTRERVRAARAAGDSLDGLDLSGVDLSGEDLSGIALTGAVLDGAKLDGANLRAAILSDASLEGASLNGADLSDALLDGAVLANSQGANLRLDGAQLLGANLNGCVWRSALFRRTNLKQAYAKQAQLDGSTFDETDLSEANFEGGSFAETSFTGTTATGTRFNGAGFGPSVFHECQLTEADFSAAKLNAVRFVRCVLDDAMFEQTHAPELELAISSVARLRASEAHLAGARLMRIEGQDGVFEGGVLTGATVSECKLVGADFSGAKLNHARVSGCDLKKSKFMKADLTSAALTGCDFFESTFEGAQMERCDGTQSSFFGSEFLDAQVAQFHGKQRDLGGTKLAERS